MLLGHHHVPVADCCYALIIAERLRRSSLSSKAVQSLGYRYDQVGNLTALDDALRKSGPLSVSRTCARSLATDQTGP
jgi:hypothetical protein